ncbi:asparagine synthase-related protein [Streptomyces sp. NBC_01381]|uniref:asparagine synthase-related protein n=1 Tax=Streptomyces sp. NBC_01381 TaxID=2903845 RepID=UPI00225A726B|nr:asparagine synthase-related protein [Streptomyces sp. NBC_01381]MCX4669072.1 asparagine synthase-related protein [Streptomyces sp. NBC_01381]
MTGTGSVLVGDYTGCRGQVHFGDPDSRITYVAAPFGQRPAPPETGRLAVQWHAAPDAPRVPAPADRERLLLSGPVMGPVTPDRVRQIASALKNARYAELARLPGDLAGCLVTEHRVFLFRSATSREGLLHRRDGALLRWSTDPTDLLDGPEEFDHEAIWRSCRGDEVFIYDNLTPVLPGQVVVVDRDRVDVVEYDPIVPLELPRHTTMPEYAEIAYDLILQAVRPYTGRGRIGILLSGGLDSGAVLTALVDSGADVVAYHQATDDPLADESGYAREVCDHLGVPFVPVMMDHDEGYLSEKWELPHPYNNIAFRWQEQIADRIERDGITFLTWGRDGDMVFGPTRYGLYEVLHGDLRLREKAALCRGLLCSRFESSRILRSASASSSVLGDLVPTGDNARATDFLTPLPGVPDDRFSDAYSARDHCVDLSVWRPRGIQLCSPLGDKGIRRLAARMPDAYRLLPYQGRLITKPVLRLLLSTRLPERIWRRYGRLWLDSPHKNYALNHGQVLADLIGRPDAHLIRMGIVDPRQLARVLAEPASLRRNAEQLICAAMTELFLRGDARRASVTQKGVRDASRTAG